MVGFEVANLHRRSHTAGYKGSYDVKPTEKYEQQTASDNGYGLVAGGLSFESPLLGALFLARFVVQRQRIVC